MISMRFINGAFDWCISFSPTIWTPLSSYLIVCDSSLGYPFIEFQLDGTWQVLPVCTNIYNVYIIHRSTIAGTTCTNI